MSDANHTSGSADDRTPLPWGGGLVLVFVYGFSRLVFALQGGTFAARPIEFAMQYLDPLLLKTDLLRSLFYLHTQPPLFNAFLGVVLKLSPDPALTFELIYKTGGLLMALLLYGILVALGIRSWIAVVASAVFVLNPTVFLYEHLLYYTFWEGVLVLLAVFCLACWTRSHGLMPLIGFWGALVCLGLVRSLFHPVFFPAVATALVCGLCCSTGPRPRVRTFLVIAVVMLVPVMLVCAKNTAVYGFFGTSSWSGMNLWTKANGYAPEQLEQLYDAGLISDTALQADLQAFQPISGYFPSDELAQIDCHHPADCAVFKSTGRPNFNHSGFVGISQQLGRDAAALIRHDPGLFAWYTLGSYSLTLWHASDSVHGIFEPNLERLATLEQVYRFVYFGFLGVASKHDVPGIWVRTALITLLFLVVYGITAVCCVRRNKGASLTVRIVGMFCMVVHAYVIAVSSLVEFGENNRFRFPVDGAFAVLMAICALQCAPAVRRWRNRRSRSDGCASGLRKGKAA